MPSKPSEKAARALELMKKGLPSDVVSARLGLSMATLEKIRKRDRERVSA